MSVGEWEGEDPSHCKGKGRPFSFQHLNPFSNIRHIRNNVKDYTLMECVDDHINDENNTAALLIEIEQKAREARPTEEILELELSANSNKHQKTFHEEE